MARAGEYAAEWMVRDLSGLHRRLLGSAPRAIRVRLSMRLTRTLVRSTYRSSRAMIRWRKGKASVDIRGSIFCEVRDRVERPLCEFYVSAIRRLMQLFEIAVDINTDQCRATGKGNCIMSVSVQQG